MIRLRVVLGLAVVIALGAPHAHADKFNWEGQVEVDAADLQSDDAKKRGDIGGAEATSALTRSLGDADPAVRQRAVKSLGRIGLRGNPAVVVALIPRLEDDKSDVRRETVDQLEQLGDRRAVIPLVSRFGD